MKFAAFGRINWRWNIAGQDNALTLYFWIRNRHCGKQCLRIGMQGVSIELFLACNFREIPKIHDAHPVADMLYNAQIMRDENIGKVAGTFEFYHQI